ncbi:MAG: helix-turn-helix transcriptional regulator [Flavobacteriales bacterium]|nr:helix-turn-helix transcriptional regulator [Flavobacteriales bacterium]
MTQTLEIHKVSKMHQLGDLPPPKHPLISIISNQELKSTSNLKGIKIINYLYNIIFKSSNTCSSFSYGRNSYDHEEGTLVFTAPGQVMEFNDDNSQNEQIDPDGWSLIIHPDLFRKSQLTDKMNQYSFFQYDSNEALHVSNEERISIEDLLKKIEQEYNQTLDRHSQKLIVSNIALLLDYCLRYYDRQFYSRTNLNNDIISKFEKFLINYYESGQAFQTGIPSVEYCAKQLHFSPNYLSDLLKKETGKTTLEHIHYFLIERAKNSLLNSTDTISGIAYSLGFDYPQRFSNLFKSKTGMSPKEYRFMN